MTGSNVEHILVINCNGFGLLTKQTSDAQLADHIFRLNAIYT